MYNNNYKANNLCIKMPKTIDNAVITEEIIINLFKTATKSAKDKLKVLYFKFCSCKNAYKIESDPLAPNIFNDNREGCRVSITQIINKKAYERCSRCLNYNTRTDLFYSEEIIKKFREL